MVSGKLPAVPRYRQKVRSCLDVFARMLSEARFDADDPQGQKTRGDGHTTPQRHAPIA